MSNDLCLGVRNSDFSQLAFFNQCQVGQEGKGLPVTPEFLPQMQESTGDMQGEKSVVSRICGDFQISDVTLRQVVCCIGNHVAMHDRLRVSEIEEPAVLGPL